MVLPYRSESLQTGMRKNSYWFAKVDPDNCIALVELRLDFNYFLKKGLKNRLKD